MNKDRHHIKLEKAIHTPWGNADSQIHYADGIDFFSTPSHGGFRLSAKRLKEMPERIRVIPTFCRLPMWYEEDCDWALVAVAFPQYFDGYEHFQAVKTLESYHPEALAQEDKDRAARWLDQNRNLFAKGSEGSTKDGWFVNAYSLVNPDEKIGRGFRGMPVIPATFTREEFLHNDWAIL